MAEASSSSGAVDHSEASRKRKAAPDAGHRFQTQIRQMMYGFGDSRKPVAASVHLMEDIVFDYLHQVVHRACIASEERQRSSGRASSSEVRLKEKDLLFVLRKEPQKRERVQEILDLLHDIEMAKKPKKLEEYANEEKEDAPGKEEAAVTKNKT